MNNQQKQQVLEQVKAANNVLVAVSTNPTVDELAASVGLTLVLNKLGKHATTVFSGVVPSTIEFLQPEKTIETTTDSLRDFIIALDKSKADKLRYKVEDDVVRIFITPYRTTITDKDLDFSHGDFNVDVVLALGVTRREDLDKAIIAHGRILHDATVVALTTREVTSELGSLNWQEQQASSLCEMVTSLVYDLQPDVIDGQMATAFLTGIIAETDRFKNEKTTPLALSLSSQLMSAGANQQLIAEKLDEPAPPPIPLNQTTSAPATSADGELEIDHDSAEDAIEKIHIDEHGNLGEPQEVPQELPEVQDRPEENFEEQTPGQDETPRDQDFLGAPSDDRTNDEDSESQPTLTQPELSTPFLTHGKTIEPPVDPDTPPKSDKPFDLQEALQASSDVEEPAPSATAAEPAPAAPEPLAPPPAPAPVEPPAEVPPAPQMPPTFQSGIPPASTVAAPASDSLADLERSLNSPHTAEQQPAEGSGDDPLQAAQNAVAQAAEALPPQFPPADQAVGAHPVDLNPTQPMQSAPSPQSNDPNAPPPVPPPMTPQFYDADGNNNNPFLNPDAH